MREEIIHFYLFYTRVKWTKAATMNADCEMEFLYRLVRLVSNSQHCTGERSKIISQTLLYLDPQKKRCDTTFLQIYTRGAFKRSWCLNKRVAIATRITYHALVYRGVFLEVALVRLVRCQSGRSFRWLLLNVLPPHPVHPRASLVPLATEQVDASSVGWCFLPRSQREITFLFTNSIVRGEHRTRDSTDDDRFSLSFIKNHAPIARQPLRQRLSLIFVKCHSLFRHDGV